MFRLRSLIWLIALGILATRLAPSTAQADIVSLVSTPDLVTGANVNALAGPISSSDKGEADIMDPGSGVVSATKFGNTATHEYGVGFDYSSGPAFFDSVFSDTFERTAVTGERASAESIFQFTVDTPAFYESMGFFDVVDAVGTTIPGNVELEIELLEFDAFDGSPPSAVLFKSYQVSKTTMDQSFLVGGTDGETSELVGSATGLLDPSKFYRYRTLVTINAIDIDEGGPLLPTDGGASASGAHVLLISKAESIPEPTGLGLISILAISVVFRRRQR